MTQTTREDERTSNEMNLNEIVGLVHRDRHLLILFITSAMLASLLITYIFSDKYQAATIVMYRPTDAVEIQPNAVIPDKTALGFPSPTPPFEAVGATIERLGKSERVLRRVVTELGLDQPESNDRVGLAWYYAEVKSTAKRWLSNTWEILKFGRTIDEDPTTSAIIGLMKYVTIEAREDYTSTLIAVDKFPERAALIVDHVGRILVEEARQIRLQSAEECSKELANRLDTKTQQIQAVRARIDQHKEKWNFHSLTDEMPLHLTSLETFETQLLENQGKSEDARAKLESLTTQRAELEATIPSSQTVQDDPLYTELKALRSNHHVELLGLLDRRGPNHIDVVGVKAQIEEIEAQLSRLEETRVTNKVTASNPAYESVLLAEIQARSTLQGLQAAGESLAESIQRLQQRIVAPNVVSEAQAMGLELRTLEAEYAHLAAALEEANTAAIAGIPEIQILFPATPIRKPIKPIKIYHVALSGLLALSFGLTFIFLVDFIKSLWYTPLLMAPAPNRSQPASA